MSNITKGKGFIIEWNDEEIIAAFHQASVEGIDDNLLDLQRKVIPLVPIESNDLRNDANIDRSQLQRKLEGALGFSLPYALKQHEDLELRHDRTDGYRIATGKNAGKSVNLIAGGEPKFLERPFNENKAKYIRHLANKARAVTGG